MPTSTTNVEEELKPAKVQIRVVWASPNGIRSAVLAQRLLMLLGTLAHNLLIWSRRWRSRSSPQQASRLRQYGIKRMVRDLYQISGTLSFDRRGRLHVISLQPTSSLAKLMLVPLQKLLALSHIAVNLGQT
jgi:hypothetical protein